MHRFIPLTALAVVFALPVAAADQNGRNGEDRGRPGNSDDRGRGNEDRARGKADDRGQTRADNDRGDDRMDRGRSNDRPSVAMVRDQARDQIRQTVTGADRGDMGRAGRESANGLRGLIAGCPPGLAKKDNGCLPPGQARQIARTRLDNLWGAGKADSDRYRYDNGYLYRSAPDGSLLGYLPVLGGALSPGNPWPAQFASAPLADYQSRYLGLGQNLDYRYADGTVYGLDRNTGTISQVAALMTGQQINVGQAMPAGYDIYNLPQQYRDRYVDSASAQYRYNDGQVYQVDPKTQLVQSVIQLLT
jgi:hypothetical protein